MTGALVGAGAAVGAGVIAWIYRGVRQNRILSERLLTRPGKVEVEDGEVSAELELEAPRPWLARRRWIAWVLGTFTGLALIAFLGLALSYAAAIGVMVGVLAHLIEDQWAAKRTLFIEAQLAEAIDLMVASLSAGAGVMEAMESAAAEIKNPLRGELEQVVGRIRFGHEQRDALHGLSERIPLENFHLFSFTLAVHGESGGSLAPTLSTVGESIRDRIGMTRMARSQSAQAQASVVGILLITWFLGVMMWRTAPERFEEFLVAPFGATLTAGAMMLQAVGLVWISKLSKLRF